MYVFLSSDALAYSGAHFGEGTGPIFLGSLNCSGEETDLLNCVTLGGVRFGCSHGNDAGVECKRTCTTLLQQFSL